MSSIGFLKVEHQGASARGPVPFGFEPRRVRGQADLIMDLFARFETELSVRPDDIDLYQHVHSTKYLDYVLAARFDQMERCYGMSMQEFAKRGLGWFMKSATIHFRRPLGWGDRMLVRTWIETMEESGVKVGFLILKKETQKTVCEGVTDYTLVDLKTGRATPLPEDVKQKYGI